MNMARQAQTAIGTATVLAIQWTFPMPFVSIQETLAAPPPFPPLALPLSRYLALCVYVH
jgi:hypothetical protein